jgi:hypothetical protein
MDRFFNFFQKNQILKFFDPDWDLIWVKKGFKWKVLCHPGQNIFVQIIILPIFGASGAILKSSIIFYPGKVQTIIY